MRCYYYLIYLCVTFFSLGNSANSLALDVYISPPPQSNLDMRDHYKNALLKLALDVTEDEYGPYEIRLDGPKMNLSRAQRELASGELINTYFAVENPGFDEQTTRIAIPIRRGILHYRLFLVRNEDAEAFSQIENVEQLKKLRTGLQFDWSTTRYLAAYGFSYVRASDYEGMFSMLEQGRFDYILRGANDIYRELEKRPEFAKKVTVAPGVMLYVPISTYAYVSKSHPRLSERLRLGLERISNSGQLAALFNEFFGQSLKRAQLCGRKLLFIEEHHKRIYEQMQGLIHKPCD